MKFEDISETSPVTKNSERSCKSGKVQRVN